MSRRAVHSLKSTPPPREIIGRLSGIFQETLGKPFGNLFVTFQAPFENFACPNVVPNSGHVEKETQRKMMGAIHRPSKQRTHVEKETLLPSNAINIKQCLSEPVEILWTCREGDPPIFSYILHSPFGPFGSEVKPLKSNCLQDCIHKVKK